jgi:hypothetical protein
VEDIINTERGKMVKHNNGTCPFDGFGGCYGVGVYLDDCGRVAFVFVRLETTDLVM